jgi:DUF4097 and DUF4098 domain-containing protein YvlB
MNRTKVGFALVTIAALVVFAPVCSSASVEGSFQRTLTVNGAVDLDINTGSGSISVRTGSSGKVEVTGHIKATEWFDSGAQEKVRRLESNPPIQQSGNSIHIGHMQDRDLQRNISISYEVVVPAETRVKAHSGSGAQTIDGIGGPLEVDAGSGAVKISNIGSTVRAETGSGNMDIDHVQGNVRAHAGSGSIRATDIHGGFEGNTGSGRISLSQTAPGAVHVETGSGGMELRGVHGTLEARAGSGGITAEGDPTGGWMVHSGSGSIHLRLPSDASFDLNARTSSGSISLDHPVTVQGTMGKKEIRGKVRGGGVTVEVETGSGNIEIL